MLYKAILEFKDNISYIKLKLIRIAIKHKIQRIINISCILRLLE